jgi:hypothetical protein
MKKINETTVEIEEVTPAVKESTKKVEKTIDELIAESENFAKGISNNESSKVVADEMIAILTEKKAKVDADIAQANKLGVKSI